MLDKSKLLVRIVDDDADIREAVSFLLTCNDWQVACFDSAEALLAEGVGSEAGCILIDIRMPGMSGLELQEELKKRSVDLPMIFLTGHGTVDSAVRALKLGAFDFLQKPVNEEVLTETIEEACKLSLNARSGDLKVENMRKIYTEMSPREQELAGLLKQGLENAEIAERLGLSTRTVQGHRNNLYKKFRIHNQKQLQSVLARIDLS